MPLPADAPVRLLFTKALLRTLVRKTPELLRYTPKVSLARTLFLISAPEKSPPWVMPTTSWAKSEVGSDWIVKPLMTTRSAWIWKPLDDDGGWTMASWVGSAVKALR